MQATVVMATLADSDMVSDSYYYFNNLNNNNNKFISNSSLVISNIFSFGQRYGGWERKT